MQKTEELQYWISNRRSIFPKMYNGHPISDDEIWQILEMANWAPNHKNTEPWRFQVFRGNAKLKLGKYLQDYYKTHSNESSFSQSKFEKTYAKAVQSDCIIAIILHTDPLNRLPEWEELAAVACAVQNMWLMSSSMSIGAYWSSPKSAIEGDAFFQLEENEQCLGLFYMGKYDSIEQIAQRGDIKEKVKWRNE